MSIPNINLLKSEIARIKKIEKGREFCDSTLKFFHRLDTELTDIAQIMAIYENNVKTSTQTIRDNKMDSFKELQDKYKNLEEKSKNDVKLYETNAIDMRNTIDRNHEIIYNITNEVNELKNTNAILEQEIKRLSDVDVICVLYEKCTILKDKIKLLIEENCYLENEISKLHNST